jgi:hypothetical protein
MAVDGVFLSSGAVDLDEVDEGLGEALSVGHGGGSWGMDV